jgi:DNA repair protein RecO (recombination protein O)
MQGTDRPRLYKADGVVLKQMPLGEADRLLTIHTDALGKLRAVARGVRRPRSRLAGHLEPLTHVRLLVARGRNLDVVTGAETLRGFPRLRDDLGSIARGLVCAELVDAFTVEGQPNQPLLDLLVETLARLEEGAGDSLLWHYVFHVLRLTGFMPELHNCVVCGKEVLPDRHSFSPGLGGVVCAECVRAGMPGVQPTGAGAPVLPLSLSAIKVLRHFRDHSYDAVEGLRLGFDLLRELERLLGGYVRYLLERALKSSAFLARLDRLSRDSVARGPQAPARPRVS